MEKPQQIVSDKGSDLDKGIRLYQEKNLKVIHTYDVTHKRRFKKRLFRTYGDKLGLLKQAS
jgi:hypothetical protein